MIIRQALSQDAVELAEFNISMARETEAVELIPEVITAGVRHMIENPQLGFYLVVELDNGIQASLMVTTEWSDWRNGMLVDSKCLCAYGLSSSGVVSGTLCPGQRIGRTGTLGLWIPAICRTGKHQRAKNIRVTGYA